MNPHPTRRARSLHLSWVGLITCLASTAPSKAAATKGPPTPVPTAPDITAEANHPGLTMQVVQHQGVRWTVATVDLLKAHLVLLGQGAGADKIHSYAALDKHLVATTGRRAALVTNAGIFHPGHEPVGLHVEAGVTLQPVDRNEGDGNFYLLPNGVFSIDATGAHVTPTARWTAPKSGLILATQSGPLLLDGGAIHPKFNPDSPHRKIRSGVGISDPHTVHLALSHGPVRFHDAATLFRDVLGCAGALYLDGTISTMRSPLRPRARSHPGGYAGFLVVLEAETRPPLEEP